MNKGLEEIRNPIGCEFSVSRKKYVYTEEQVNTIEKELKELDKIKARLTVVKIKLASKREECSQNMQHTDEEDFVHESSEITMRCLDWFRDMINEVLL